MDNENTNSPVEAEQPHLNLTPEPVGKPEEEVTPAETEETPAEQPTEQPKEETPTAEPKEEPKETKEEPKEDLPDEQFVTKIVAQELGDYATQDLVNECLTELKNIGITDKGMAEKALRYVLRSRENFMIKESEAVLKHFNSTRTNQTTEYNKAMSDASLAIDAIEAKVKGFKNMIGLAGIQSSLPMVLAMSSLYPVLCEDRNFMNGGTNAQEAPVSIAETLFGAKNFRKV